MLPTGSAAATGPLWVPANRALLDQVYRRSKLGGNFFRRIGWRSGVVGIGRLVLPGVTGWVVLVDDNAAGVTLPPGTPTAGNPPTAPPVAGTITIVNPGNQPAGPIPVSGTVTPAGTPVSLVAVRGGVETGPVTAAVVAGGAWDGVVNMAIGTGVQIRARQTANPYRFADCAPFNAT